MSWCFWSVMLEKTLESPLDSKEIKPVNPNGNQTWILIVMTDAEAEASILWPPDVKNRLIKKIPWCWERLKAGGEGDDRGWDSWMASPTRWTWVWVSSGSWWWTGKPGVLQFMGSQSVGHDWATELNSAYKLNNQGDNIQPWCTHFPIWNQSIVRCLVLTVASWPAYRFLRKQVRLSDITISIKILHSLLSSTQSKSLA